MSLLKQINLLVEADDEQKVDKAPLFKDEEKTKEKVEVKDDPEDSADDEVEVEKETETEVEEVPDDAPKPEAASQDVGTVVAEEGYEKESKEMFAFGKTRKVTVLTKTEPLGGLEVTYQYLINPKTGAWTMRACLAGQTEEDMVEFHQGEDPTSLVTHLKKKDKLTPEQAVNNLNPPADPKTE